MTSEQFRNDFWIGVLTILFVGLKLTNYIDWSWWWVLSPIWIVAIYRITMIAVGIIYLKKKRPWELEFYLRRYKR